MIDRIFMFIHFFSSEKSFDIKDNGFLIIEKAGKDLYFMFDIKNKKGFSLEYEDKLIYFEIPVTRNMIIVK